MNFINTFGLHEMQGHACERNPSIRTDAPLHLPHRSSRSMPSSCVLPTDSVGGLVVINRIVLTMPPVAADERVRVNLYAGICSLSVRIIRSPRRYERKIDSPTEDTVYMISRDC